MAQVFQCDACKKIGTPAGEVLKKHICKDCYEKVEKVLNPAPQYEYSITDDAVAERRASACAERGCVIVEPQPDELQVDIDSYHCLGVFHGNLRALGDLVQTHVVKSSPSRKAGRYHITVKLSRPVKDDFERIALQCLLGSDLAREMVSWREATLGLKKPTVFFEEGTRA